jgi:FtsZ-binding cell division protein ZapB
MFVVHDADPDRPRNDKATIITETIQVLKDITSEVDRLKTEHKSLSEESHEVRFFYSFNLSLRSSLCASSFIHLILYSQLIKEKNELREEKASLKSDIENLNSQYQQRVRAMPPWTAIDHSVVMSSPYTYPIPMPMPIPPGPVSIHPPMQPFPYYGNQNPGHIPSLSSMYIPFSAPAIPPIEMPSAQYPSTSHVFSRKES